MKKLLALLLMCMIALPAWAEEAPAPVPEGFVRLNPSGASIDLDGDGMAESVSMTLDVDEYNYGEFTITVNDSSASAYGDGLTGELYAVELCGQTYVLTTEYGPSDDPYSHFFAYDGEILANIGGIPAFPDQMRLTDTGVTATVRGSILQTWYRPGDFIVARGGYWDYETEEYVSLPSRIVEVPRSVYPMGTVVKTLVDLDLAVSPTDSSVALHMPAGAMAAIAATDDLEWIYVVNIDPSATYDWYNAGWVHVTDGWQVDTPEGQMSPAQVFSGLMFAD